MSHRAAIWHTDLHGTATIWPTELQAGEIMKEIENCFLHKHVGENISDKLQGAAFVAMIVAQRINNRQN